MPYDPNKTEERILVAVDTLSALITACDFYATEPALQVITERKGDINAEIAKALSSLGLATIVIAPDGDSLQHFGGALRLRVRFVIEIAENVLINQANAQKAGSPYRSALGAATAVMKAIDQKPNGLDLQGAAHQLGLNEFALPEEEPPFRLVPAARPTYHVTAYSLIEL